jgi:hypothetical protein
MRDVEMQKWGSEVAKAADSCWPPHMVVSVTLTAALNSGSPDSCIRIQARQGNVLKVTAKSVRKGMHFQQTESLRV